MSTPYTPDNTNLPASYTLPSDGDPKDAASVDVPFEGLADGVAYMAAQVYGCKTDDLLPIPLTPIVNVNSRFGFPTVFPETGAAAAGASWTQSSIADKGPIVFPIDNLPKRGKITEIYATVRGSAGHAGLPTGMPAIQLWAQDEGDPSALPVRVATRNDSSANTTDYETAHKIHMIGLAETFDNASQLRYFVAFYGETGTNSQLGLALVDISVVVAPEV